MKKRNNLSYFLITLAFFTYFNFYISGFIAYKVAHNWHFSNALLSIISIKNTGAAFSIMQNFTWFLIVLSVLAVIGIVFYVVKDIQRLQFKMILFVSLLLSGILGNLYERICWGYVRDFFALKFINFPVFNVSDVFINIGVIGIIILLFYEK